MLREIQNGPTCYVVHKINLARQLYVKLGGQQVQLARHLFNSVASVSVKVVVASVMLQPDMPQPIRCVFGVEHDESDGQPIARRATPALGERTAHALVQFVAAREDHAFTPVMPLVPPAPSATGSVAGPLSPEPTAMH